jgi:hypothetical protein
MGALLMLAPALALMIMPLSEADEAQYAPE